MNMNDLMAEAPSLNFDINKIRPLDSWKEWEDRLYELQELLDEKIQLEETNRDQVRILQQKLQSEKNGPSGNGASNNGDVRKIVDDLNVAYDDIITSTKEHLQMNAAIMRKEKEIKELEARIALLSTPASEDEYWRLFSVYE